MDITSVMLTPYGAYVDSAMMILLIYDDDAAATFAALPRVVVIIAAATMPCYASYVILRFSLMLSALTPCCAIDTFRAADAMRRTRPQDAIAANITLR